MHLKDLCEVCQGKEWIRIPVKKEYDIFTEKPFEENTYELGEMPCPIYCSDLILKIKRCD